DRFYQLDTDKPRGMLWHYTAGQGDGNEEYDYDHPDHSGEDLAKRIRKVDGNKPSWTGLIAKAGDFFQSVSFLKGAWHVGKGAVIAGRHFANINHAVAGIEIENAGRLKRIDGAFYCWPYYRQGADGKAH